MIGLKAFAARLERAIAEAERKAKRHRWVCTKATDGYGVGYRHEQGMGNRVGG